MKWTRSELAGKQNGTFPFEESVSFDSSAFEQNGRLRDLKDVTVSGTARYDSADERLYVELTVRGVMIVPCAVTLESVEHPFHITEALTYAFHATADEDVNVVKGETVDLLPEVFQSIMAEVPWIVHKEDFVYPKGDGWEVVSEAMMQKQEKAIDPRLAKILQYQPKED